MCTQWQIQGHQAVSLRTEYMEQFTDILNQTKSTSGWISILQLFKVYKVLSTVEAALNHNWKK